MSMRGDLLELTPDALSALSNAGFVKRAQKDVSEGKLPDIVDHVDGTVVARYADGVVTSLAPGRPLRDASCTCRASNWCRHRVTLVVAYQAVHQAPASADAAAAAPWCPSHFAEDVPRLPKATLEQARRLAAGHPVIKLSAWTDSGQHPTAQLPLCTVRFFSRASLAHARCDCQQGEQCAHVAVAVWAFVQAQLQQPCFSEATVELVPATSGAGSARDETTESANRAVEGLAIQLWLDGTSQNPFGLAPRFELALDVATRLNWRWVVEGLQQLHDGIAAQHARSTRIDDAALLALLCGLMARLAAARHASALSAGNQAPMLPARQILGVGVKGGQLRLDHLRLVSLGARCWADDHSHGVQLILADPASRSINVIERSWPGPAAGATTDAAALHERRLLGQPLRRLAASQIVTKAARRGANGVIEIAAVARQTTILPLTPNAWDALGAPLRQPDGPSLRAYLHRRAPDFVQPLHVIERVHVLPVAEVLDCAWDAASQCLLAYLAIGSTAEKGVDVDAILTVVLRHDPVTPDAIDTLAHALRGSNGKPQAIAGIVHESAGRLTMTPFSLLTAHGLVVPALHAASAHALPPHAGSSSPGAVAGLLDTSRALLGMWLRQGLSHQGNSAVERAREHCERLRDAGLSGAAAALESVWDAARDEDIAQLPRRMAAFHALLDELAATCERRF
jgi:hypothetical protein